MLLQDTLNDGLYKFDFSLLKEAKFATFYCVPSNMHTIFSNNKASKNVVTIVDISLWNHRLGYASLVVLREHWHIIKFYFDLMKMMIDFYAYLVITAKHINFPFLHLCIRKL